jgi:Tol biopolymer transport system component
MRRAAAGIVVLMVAALGLWGALALARPTEGSHSVSWHILERVVISSPGAQVPGISGFPSMSADGRYLAFVSLASNLVTGDTNNQPDVFVRDRQTNQITRVSVASDGTQADNGSALTAISADGRYVAFLSLASNLVPDDTNSAVDVFVHDRQTGVTSRVNVSSGGAQANDLSGSVSISGDGRYVAFNSLASNLVGNDTNGASDIFVHDRQTNSTTRVSVTFDGSQAGGGAPVLSTDGRYVSFVSVSGLVPADTNDNQDVYVYDLLTGTLSRVSVSTGGGESVGHFFNCGVSATGRYVVFIGDEFAGDLVPGDTNGVADVYVHDRELNLTQRVSVSTTGAEGNDISACTNAPFFARIHTSFNARCSASGRIG